MSSKDLSAYLPESVPSGKGFRMAIVYTEWNREIVQGMFSDCRQTLLSFDMPEENIYSVEVPGSFELTSASQMLLESNEIDAVICLGCIIKGETPHDEHIASAVASGLTQVAIDYSTPVIFGVLTTLNEAQAKARAGGEKGNKGTEAAVTALKMAALRKKLI